jgi:hypothetical protein
MKHLKTFEYYDDNRFENCFKELVTDFKKLIQKYEEKYPDIMEYKDDVIQHLQSVLIGDDF